MRNDVGSETDFSGEGSDRAKSAQKNTYFQNSARSSMLPCSLKLTGRDPHGETAMETIKFFLLIY